MMAGVFRSTDNGDHWTSINAGLTNTKVWTIAINPGGHIFAGTAGEGVYRSIHSTTAIKEMNKEMPFSFELKQNYPNPFNSATAISYQLSALQKDGESSTFSHVQLKIYNLQGHEIRTLVDEFLAAGMKTVIWDGMDERGRRVSSGIYFYRLISGSYSETKQMLMVQ